MTALTHGRLKELLHYDPDTGLFTWIAGRRCGAVAVVNHNMGYVSLRIDYKLHLAHRLAFLYMTGTLPAMDVDHINGVRSDNRWLNLREVSHTTNMQNIRKATAASTSGFLGVALTGASGARTLALRARPNTSVHTVPQKKHIKPT